MDICRFRPSGEACVRGELEREWVLLIREPTRNREESLGARVLALLRRSRHDQRVNEPLPRPKVWRHPRLISEHAFDKLRSLDCTLAEFGIALGTAEIIEEDDAGPEQAKELLLVVDWIRPLHVVVVVDDARREERVVTIYEPAADRWCDEYRRRR